MDIWRWIIVETLWNHHHFPYEIMKEGTFACIECVKQTEDDGQVPSWIGIAMVNHIGLATLFQIDQTTFMCRQLTN